MSSLPLFRLQAITVQNPTFNDSVTLPPPNWTPNDPSVALAYDTISPFEGSQSLAMTVAAPGQGVLSDPINVAPNQYYSVSAEAISVLGDPVEVALNFYDLEGNYLGAISATGTPGNWGLITATGYAPPYAYTAQILLTLADVSLGGTAEFDAITLSGCKASAYYVSLIASQYQNSPKFLSWAKALLTPFMDAAICLASMYEAFDINEAVGVQLDMLGQILGASRILPFIPTAGQLFIVSSTATGASYVVGDVLMVIQPGASGGTIKVTSVSGLGAPLSYVIVTQGIGYSTNHSLATTGGSGNGGALVSVTVLSLSSTLDDNSYRTLLKAKVAFNQWQGQIATLYGIWNELFPGGLIVVTDGQNMTATVLLAGNFTPIIVDLINSGYIIPRPQGVQYTILFPTLPVFGYDINNSYISGFDSGHWA